MYYDQSGQYGVPNCACILLYYVYDLVSINPALAY